MITFTSIQQALKYHIQCPLCSSTLVLAREGEYSSSTEEWEFGSKARKVFHKISFPLGYGDDMLTVDLISEKIDLTVYQKVTQPIYTAGYSGQVGGYIAGNGTSYTGFTYRGITTQCKDCFNFSFTIQLEVDISNRELTGRYLNSERIMFTDKQGIKHDIRNVYSTKETHYTSSSKGEKEISSIIPLVPLNLQKPGETIARIKKLLVFA